MDRYIHQEFVATTSHNLHSAQPHFDNNKLSFPTNLLPFSNQSQTYHNWSFLIPRYNYVKSNLYIHLYLNCVPLTADEKCLSKLYNACFL